MLDPQLFEDEKGDETIRLLDGLAPTGDDLPDRYAAFGRFQKQTATRWRSPIMNKTIRRFSGAVAALAIVALFAFSPAARAAASDFLGLFRVERFAAISVSPQQISMLENLDAENLYPGEFEMISEPAPYVSFGSVEEAAGIFNSDDWRGATMTLDGFGQPSEIGIQPGGAAKLTINLEGARAILDAAGIDPTLLPDSLDGADVNATMPDMLMQSWDDGVYLAQAASPEISYPADVDPAVIGEALLRFFGMGDKEAYRLSRSIDWTNTLVMPIPADLATFAEVQVNGTSGIVIESVTGGETSLMWQTNGFVYMLAGEGLTADELVDMAESLYFVRGRSFQ